MTIRHKKLVKNLGKCEICQFDRAIDRCHFIPMRLLKVLVSLDKNKSLLMSYSGKNIIYLCKNHHWLLDHWQLEKEEFDKIKDRIIEFLKEFFEEYNKQMKYLKDNKQIKTITDWINKNDIFFKKLYGNH